MTPIWHSETNYKQSGNVPQIPAYIVLCNQPSLWGQSEGIKNVHKNFEISNQEIKILTLKLFESIFKGKGHKNRKINTFLNRI